MTKPRAKKCSRLNYLPWQSRQQVTLKRHQYYRASYQRRQQIFWNYTGRFIMFSVIRNIYNKKTKGPTLIELFTATRKLKKFLFWKLEMFDVCTTGDTAHIDTIFKILPHTRVNMGASIFFTATMIRAFRSARSRGMVFCVLCTKCTLHSNHRITRVIFQHTKRFLPWSGHFLTT